MNAISTKKHCGGGFNIEDCPFDEVIELL